MGRLMRCLRLRHEDAEPPYNSVLDAMRDGWRVIQVPFIKAPTSRARIRNDYLDFEFVLEKMEVITMDKILLTSEDGAVRKHGFFAF